MSFLRGFPGFFQHGVCTLRCKERKATILIIINILNKYTLNIVLKLITEQNNLNQEL